MQVPVVRSMQVPVVLSLVSPVVAIVIAAWSFRRTGKADRLKAFFEVHNCYLSPEVRAGRRLIHHLTIDPETGDLKEIDRSTKSSIGYTLAVLNSIAIACEGRYVDQALVEKNMGRSFTSTVHAARPFIDSVEQERVYRPYPAAERLAAQFRSALE